MERPEPDALVPIGADVLVRRLRSCPSDERRAVALALAATGGSAAIDELVRITSGGFHTYQKGTWHSLWQNVPDHYSLADQLIAVEALGETKSADVLAYLRNLYTPEIRRESRSESSSNGSDSITDSWMEEVYCYPNATGNLARALMYTIDLTTSSWGNESPNSAEHIEEERKTVPEGMRAHHIVRAAIAKLESSSEQ